MFHRLEPRIRAHVLLCWLALLLIRVAERHTGQTWRRINRELGRLHAVTLAGPAGRVEQTTALTHHPAGALRRDRDHPAAPGHQPAAHLNPVRSAPAGVGTRRTSARPLFSQLTAPIPAIACPPTAELGQTGGSVWHVNRAEPPARYLTHGLAVVDARPDLNRAIAERRCRDPRRPAEGLVQVRDTPQVEPGDLLLVCATARQSPLGWPSTARIVVAVETSCSGSPPR